MRIEVHPSSALTVAIESMLSRFYGRIEPEAVQVIATVCREAVREAFSEGFVIALDVCERMHLDDSVELEDEGLRIRQELERMRDAICLEDDDSRAQPPRDDPERRGGTNQA